MNPHRRALVTSLVLLVAAGAVAGTSASFNATTTNPGGTFSTDALNNPTSVTASAVGDTVAWSWTPGSMTSNQTDFVHRLSTKALEAGSLDGTAPACTWSDTFPTTSTIPNATTSTSIATSSANAGAWMCWRLDVQHPASSPVWFGQSSPAGAVKIGHAMASVAVANGGTAGKLDTGDTLMITFTQAVTKTTTSTAASVCVVVATDIVYVGRTEASNTSCAAVTPLVGTFTATSAVSGGNPASNNTPAFAATFVWQGTCNIGNTACTQLQVTIGAQGSGSKTPSVDVSSTLFDPVSTLTADSGTALCTTANNTGTPVICHPQMTGSF